MTAAPVTVTLAPDRLTLRPGQSADVTVTMTNTGTLVSHYETVVRGLPDSQATAEPARVELNPGDVRTVTLRITVPAQGPPYAGRHVLGVVVRSGAASRCAELTLTVPERAAMAATVRPETADGRESATYTIDVANTGNTPLTARLGADTTDRGVTLAVRPATVTVAPGATASADLEVTAPRPWTGGTGRVLRIVAATGPLRTEHQALFRQRPRLAGGLLRVAGPAAGVLVLAGAIGGAAVIVRGGPEAAPIPTSPPSASASRTVILDFDRVPGDALVAPERYAAQGVLISTVLDRAGPGCGGATALAQRTDPVLGAYLTSAHPTGVGLCNGVPLRFEFPAAATAVRLTFTGHGETCTLIAQLSNGTRTETRAVSAPGAATPVSAEAKPGLTILSVVFGGGDPVAVKQLAVTPP